MVSPNGRHLLMPVVFQLLQAAVAIGNLIYINPANVIRIPSTCHHRVAGQHSSDNDPRDSQLLDVSAFSRTNEFKCLNSIYLHCYL